MMRRYLVAVLALLPSIALLGCQQGPDEAKKIEEAEKGVCAQLARIDDAIEKAAALTPNSTVGDLQAARVELRDAMRELFPYEKELETARYKDYDLKGKEVRSELKSIETDPQLTPAQASEKLQSKVAAAAAAHQALTATVDCPSS